MYTNYNKININSLLTKAVQYITYLSKFNRLCKRKMLDSICFRFFLYWQNCRLVGIKSIVSSIKGISRVKLPYERVVGTVVISIVRNIQWTAVPTWVQAVWVSVIKWVYRVHTRIIYLTRSHTNFISDYRIRQHRFTISREVDSRGSKSCKG